MPENTRPTQPLRLGVLISGGGSTLLNLAECIERGVLDAEIALVIASNPAAAGIDRARDRGLAVEVVPRKQYDSPDAFSDALWPKLRDAGVDLVVLAGFLSLIRIPDDFQHRVVNIHPALLPRYGGQGMYGKHVHRAVIDAGDAESGCTVHFADNQYDQGPVILQRRCPVEPGDTPETLADRVQSVERRALPEAIQLIAERRVQVRDGAVEIT